MQRKLLLTIIIAFSLQLLGNPVDEDTAKQLAQSFWKENNIMGIRDGKVLKKKMGDARFVNVAPHCRYSEFFIFNNEDGKGFVIIAADDRVTPILGYSYDNNFAAEDLPPNLKGWLDGYAEQIRAAIETRAEATDEIRTDWECLRQGKRLPIKSERAVEPLLANNVWSQRCYYNSLCPTDTAGPCGHTLTGCTGTAMAQIMHYWSYPIKGAGSTTYTPTGYPTQSVNFSEAVYDWNHMPDTLSSSSSDAQVMEVAKLLWHCGVALHASYGPNGTPALPADVSNALKTYFTYSNDCYGQTKQSNDAWLVKVKNCLDLGRPIHYNGWNDNYQVGHSFVCDGYDVFDNLSFNWGWGGQYNGYFPLTALNPGDHQFNYEHYAIFDIHPRNESVFSLVYHSDVRMSNTDYRFFDDLSVHSEILNNGGLDFDGYIGAGVYRETDNEYIYVGMLGRWDLTTSPLHSGHYYSGDLVKAGGPPYIPGSYMTTLLYSRDGDHWNAIDNGDYHDGYFDISYSQNIEKNSVISIVSGDSLYNNTNATVNVDILNTGSSTFYGQFRISLRNPTGEWMQTIDVVNCTNGLQPNHHYTNGLDFRGLITVAPGTYLMSIDFKESGSSSWNYAGASNYQNPIWIKVAPEPIILADSYEPNNSQNLAYSFTPIFSGNTATVNTTGSTLHNSSDVDYYKINLTSGYDYTITPRLHDANNSGNGNTYSVDAKFAYSTDGVNWSVFYDDVMTGNISITNGGTVYFHVISHNAGDIGSYLLSMGISRTQHLYNYTISTTANPNNGGTTSGGGTYIQGQTCTVHAIANNGYTFVNWTENGAPVSTNANYTFIVTGNRNLVAQFQAQTYTIAVNANPIGGGTVTGDGTYQYGQTCTLTATSSVGYHFVSWTEGHNVVSTDNTFSFTVIGNRSLRGNFELDIVEIEAIAKPEDAAIVNGAGSYRYGDEVTLTMVRNEDWAFQYWTKDDEVVSDETTYSFIATEDCVLVAHLMYTEGIGENSIAAKVYPNPTKDNVTIECEGMSHVRIVNAYGQTVYDTDHEGEQAVIDLSQIVKGIYMMHIGTNEGQIVRKIVVE